MIKVLVIGGEGYIGSKLMQYLEPSVFQVTSLDIGWFYNKDPSKVSHHSYVRGRPRDITYIEAWDVIVWLAGHSSVRMCENNEHSAFENNYTEFSDFLKIYNRVPKHKKPLIIFTSSSSVFGNTIELCTEDMIPKNSYSCIYDRTMRGRELCFLSGNFDRVIGLRLGTVCGFSPNQREELMLNSMVKAAITEGKIYYSNPDTRRAILDLDELCYSIKKIIGRYASTYYIFDIENNTLSGIYNIASYNSTVGELVYQTYDTIRSLGLKVELEEVVSPPSPYSFHIDCSKLKKIVDRPAIHPTIEDTVKSIYRGYQNIKDYNYFGNRDEPIKFEY
jgi:nucleoside-diphosphate-sugar epimerase